MNCYFFPFNFFFPSQYHIIHNIIKYIRPDAICDYAASAVPPQQHTILHNITILYFTDVYMPVPSSDRPQVLGHTRHTQFYTTILILLFLVLSFITVSQFSTVQKFKTLPLSVTRYVIYFMLCIQNTFIRVFGNLNANFTRQYSVINPFVMEFLFAPCLYYSPLFKCTLFENDYGFMVERNINVKS